MVKALKANQSPPPTPSSTLSPMSRNKGRWFDANIAREPEVRVRLTRCPEADAAVAELNKRQLNLQNAPRSNTKFPSSSKTAPYLQQPPSCPNSIRSTRKRISRKPEPSLLEGRCFVCKSTRTERRQNSSSKYLEKILLFRTIVLSRDYWDTIPPQSEEPSLDVFNCVCDECLSIVNQLWDLHNKVQALQEEIDSIVERARTTISSSSSTSTKNLEEIEFQELEGDLPKTATTPWPSSEVQTPSPGDQHGLNSTCFGDVGKMNANSKADEDEDSQTILEFEVESVEGMKMEVDSELEVDDNDPFDMVENPEVAEDSGSELSISGSHSDNSEFKPEQTDEESNESDNDGCSRKKKQSRQVLSPKYSFAAMEDTEIMPGTDGCASNSTRTLRGGSKYETRTDEEHGALPPITVPTGGTGPKSKLYRLLINKRTRKRKRTNNNPHVCLVCMKSYSRKDDFIQHLYNHESEEAEEDKCLSCQICEKKFTVQQLLDRHILFHLQDSTKPLACPHCELRFALDDEEALDRHMIFRHKVIDRLACHQCEINFQYRSHLYKHDFQCHPDKFNLVCTYECEKRYSSQQYHETHVITHTEGPYNCTACSMKCITAASLSEHLLGHTGQREEPQLSKEKREFVCTICNKFFCTDKRFAIHMESVHKKIKPHECSVCHIVYGVKRDLIRHMFTHENETEEKGLSCRICVKKFAIQLLLDRHVSLHGLDSTKPLSCPVCEMRFKPDEQQVLDKHLKDVHTTDKPQVSCSVCSKSFANQTQLKSHDYIHHPERRNLICLHTNCGKKYASQQYLNAHVVTHSDGPFHCTVCKMKFSIPGALADHLMRHTGEPQHKCEICDKSYRGVEELVSHQATIHGEEKPHKCQHCDARFLTDGKKKYHEKHYHSNSKDIRVKSTCSECGKEFDTPRHMRRHVLFVHGSKVSVQCHICGKQLKGSRMLKTHVNSHKGIKPFQCSTCGKMFARKPNLDVHVVTHTGEKKYKCPICGKGFTQHQSISRHMVGHTKEKPYLCTICGQRFTQSQSLKRHTLLAHNSQD